MSSPTWIDHLVFAAPTLDEGVAVVQAALGVTPIRGGVHPGRGTQNALASLGPPTYLEVIAPDPAQAGHAPMPFGLDVLGAPPRLVAFAVGCADIDATVAELHAAGFTDVGAPSAMSRVLPSGSELSWRLTTLGAPPMGATPFLISWDGGTSPTHDSPDGGRLVALRAGDPSPSAPLALLAALGMTISVEATPTQWLEATIETEHGIVIVR
jgi:hypothetical protein